MCWVAKQALEKTKQRKKIMFENADFNPQKKTDFFEKNWLFTSGQQSFEENEALLPSQSDTGFFTKKI